MTRFKFKKEDIINVKELYKELKSANKVATIYNCDVRTVLKFLKQNDVRVDLRMSKTKYSCNNLVFDEINSNSAYWLGFLMADGSHNEEKNNFSLVQRTSESDNLESFKNFLEFTGEVKHYINKNNNKYSRLYVTNLTISKRLTELGIMQNKTHILEFPNYINNEILFKNFLRGYFDGDGSISCGLFTIVGNNKFLLSLQQNIIKYLGFKKTVFNKRHKEYDNEIFTMSYGGKNNILKLFKFIYEDSNYFSRYKYEKFINDIKNNFNLNNSVTTKMELINFYYKKSGFENNKKIISEKPVYQYSLSGEFIRKYDRLSIAGENMKIKPSCISASIKIKGTSAGFQWTYEYKEKLEPLQIRGCNNFNKLNFYKNKI